MHKVADLAEIRYNVTVFGSRDAIGSLYRSAVAVTSDSTSAADLHKFENELY